MYNGLIYFKCVILSVTKFNFSKYSSILCINQDLRYRWRFKEEDPYIVKTTYFSS